MFRRASLASICCFLIVLLSGCRTIQQIQEPVQPSPTQFETHIPTPSPLPLPPSSTPPPTPSTVPTAEPEPTHTAVPKPIVNVYLTGSIPGLWQETIAETIQQMGLIASEWVWYITADPAAAHLTFEPGGQGDPVFSHPIALTVPFTADWEETSLNHAREIIQNGHELVTIMDWELMPRTSKALRIDGLNPDDPAYPLQQPWSIIAEDAFQSAASLLSAQIAANPPPANRVKITAVGDIMLGRSLGGAIQGGNLAYPFEDVAHLLTGADLTIGNLESALGDTGQPAPKSYAFQAPPAAAEALALAGFDIVSLANNHGMDYGPDSLLQGIDLLRRQNVAPIGAGASLAETRAPYIQTVNGLRLAFLAYVHVPVEGKTSFDVEIWDAGENSPGLAWAYQERIAADVTAARDLADLVIVNLHSGFEYVEAPSPPQIAAARAAVDAGAALVIGHHAHILQGIEFYNNGVIIYGLGNFAFEIDGDPATAILNVWLDENGVHQIQLLPAIIQFGGQPRPAEIYEAGPILQRVYFLTTLLNAH